MADLQACIERTGGGVDASAAHLHWGYDTRESWDVLGRDMMALILGKYVPASILRFMRRGSANGGRWLCTSPAAGCTFRAWVASPAEERYVKAVLAHALLTVLVVAKDLRWGKEVHKKLNIWYAPVGGNKQLPRRAGQMLTCEHVNSGLTCFVDTAVSVLVFRREDACKVMMHELLHALGIDEAWRGAVDDNESYVDALACYMHTLWAVMLLGRRRLPQKQIGVDAAVRATREHILNAAGRVEKHFAGKEWLESTHARAYYVGKAALWYDLSAFLGRIGCLGTVQGCPDMAALGRYMRHVQAGRMFTTEIQCRIRHATGRSLRMAPTEREIQKAR